MHSIYVLTVLILNPATFSSCWNFLKSVIDVRHPRLDDRPDAQNDFVFGDCENKYLKLYSTIHKRSDQVVGNIIVRQYLAITKTPTCIILRALSKEGDMYLTTTYNFQICVARITIIHSQTRYYYYYYEWYIPDGYAGKMDWVIYFYGPYGKIWE